MSGSVKRRNIRLGGGSGGGDGAGGWEGGHFFGSNGAVNNRFPETVMESQGISLSLSLPLYLSLSFLQRHYRGKFCGARQTLQAIKDDLLMAG